MPRKARIQAKHLRRGSPYFVQIVPERLLAGLEIAGISRGEAARRLGMSPQAFQHYLKRPGGVLWRPPRCPTLVRRRLAELLGLPEPWLAGEWRALPYARERWEDLQGIAWGALHGLIVHLKEFSRARSREAVNMAVISIRRDLSIVEGVLGPDWVPRHIRGTPPPSPVVDLLAVIQELATWSERPDGSRTVPKQARVRLEAIVRTWAIHAGDRPSAAQVVQYRLIGQCRRAWLRDASARFPGFDPAAQPESFEVADSSGFPVMRLQPPWNEWSHVEHRLHELLSLARWRSEMFAPELPATALAEETAAVPVLGQAVELMLRPWLQGETVHLPAVLTLRP
jgi:hypothetical protein